MATLIFDFNGSVILWSNAVNNNDISWEDIQKTPIRSSEAWRNIFSSLSQKHKILILCSFTPIDLVKTYIREVIGYEEDSIFFIDDIFNLDSIATDPNIYLFSHDELTLAWALNSGYKTIKADAQGSHMDEIISPNFDSDQNCNENSLIEDLSIAELFNIFSDDVLNWNELLAQESIPNYSRPNNYEKWQKLLETHRMVYPKSNPDSPEYAPSNGDLTFIGKKKFVNGCEVISKDLLEGRRLVFDDSTDPKHPERVSHDRIPTPNGKVDKRRVMSLNAFKKSRLRYAERDSKGKIIYVSRNAEFDKIPEAGCGRSIGRKEVIPCYEGSNREQTKKINNSISSGSFKERKPKKLNAETWLHSLFQKIDILQKSELAGTYYVELSESEIKTLQDLSRKTTFPKLKQTLGIVLRKVQDSSQYTVTITNINVCKNWFEEINKRNNENSLPDSSSKEIEEIFPYDVASPFIINSPRPGVSPVADTFSPFPYPVENFIINSPQQPEISPVADTLPPSPYPVENFILNSPQPEISLVADTFSPFSYLVESPVNAGASNVIEEELTFPELPMRKPIARKGKQELLHSVFKPPGEIPKDNSTFSIGGTISNIPVVGILDGFKPIELMGCKMQKKGETYKVTILDIDQYTQWYNNISAGISDSTSVSNKRPRTTSYGTRYEFFPPSTSDPQNTHMISDNRNSQPAIERHELILFNTQGRTQ